MGKTIQETGAGEYVYWVSVSSVNKRKVEKVKKAYLIVGGLGFSKQTGKNPLCFDVKIYPISTKKQDIMAAQKALINWNLLCSYFLMNKQFRSMKTLRNVFKVLDTSCTEIPRTKKELISRIGYRLGGFAYIDWHKPSNVEKALEYINQDFADKTQKRLKTIG